MKNIGDSAFPSHGTMGEVIQKGMTLRDYVAIKAMQAFLSNPYVAEHWGADPAFIFREAYSQADSMLKEGKK